MLSHDLRTAEERYRLRKFLENDRKVLRFYCVWDDTNTVYGDRRPFVCKAMVMYVLMLMLVVRYCIIFWWTIL